MTTIYIITIFLFIFLSMLLCATILIQESKSMGLGASFGGGDASDALFGASTADVLKRFTAYLSVIFFVSCVLLSLWTASLGRINGQGRSPLEVEHVES